MVKRLRGDIVWANLNPTQGHEQQGHRPVLIVSHSIFNQKSGTVIAMPITSQPQRAGFPLTYRLAEDTLAKDAWVKISQIRVLATTRLGDYMARIEASEVNKILEGLQEILSE